MKMPIGFRCRSVHAISSVLLVSVLLPAGPIHGSASDDDGVSSGVVVEEVTEEPAAGKAGIRPGDVILSWSRTAAPSASGAAESPFDLVEVEVEQSPHGP